MYLPFNKEIKLNKITNKLNKFKKSPLAAVSKLFSIKTDLSQLLFELKLQVNNC